MPVVAARVPDQHAAHAACSSVAVASRLPRGQRFLVEPEARRRYVRAASRAVRPGGALVLGTFAPDGPTTCFGLPVARWDDVSVAEEFDPGFRLEHSDRKLHAHRPTALQPSTWTVLRKG